MREGNQKFRHYSSRKKIKLFLKKRKSKKRDDSWEKSTSDSGHMSERWIKKQKLKNQESVGWHVVKQ